MGWIGLSLFLALIVLGLTHWKHRMPLAMWGKVPDYAENPGITFVVAVFIFGLFGGIYSVAEDGRRHDGDYSGCTELVNRWDIVTAVRDTKTSSSFILGTGGTHTIDRYYVYQQHDKGMLLTDYNAHKTYVIEQDGQPYYERIDHVCPMPVYDFLWWSSGNTHRNKSKAGTLHVPLDTVLREFSM